MSDRKQNSNKLNKTEKATITAYKMLCTQNNTLKKSLKKTQDECEKFRNENHELDKKVALMEERFKNNIYIEVFKFLSTCSLGFAINYATNGFWQTGLTIGIPSVIVFLACILIYKK